MVSPQILINGHFRPQRVTGVQRYAKEVISQFDDQNIPYNWVQPPHNLRSDVLRQLWMQSVMSFKIPDDSVLWSPTNIGPVMCENQVLTLHDIADQLHSEWFDDKYVSWRRFILPKLLRRVRHVITVSQFSRDTIVDFYPQVEGKIDVIYNGVQHDQFYPRQDDKIKQLRDDFNLPKPFILSVGSLDERKNIRGLIEAWDLLPDQIREEADLVITGESARKFAFKLDREYDANIRFTGYVKDELLPVFYSAASIFVYPSLFEGFGLPILEAMACGTPVITSNTTALKETAGDKAYVINPHEVKSIAQAMEKMLHSETLREKYAKEGQNYAKKFEWNKTARQTKKILENAM